MDIYNSIINYNGATKSGAGTYMKFTVATISNTTINDNIAADDGGGIYNIVSDLTLDNTIISYNKVNNNNANNSTFNVSNQLKGHVDVEEANADDMFVLKHNSLNKANLKPPETYF